MEFGSDDPADETKTTHVLTVMLAEEYWSAAAWFYIGWLFYSFDVLSRFEIISMHQHLLVLL